MRSSSLLHLIIHPPTYRRKIAALVAAKKHLLLVYRKYVVYYIDMESIKFSRTLVASACESFCGAAMLAFFNGVGVVVVVDTYNRWSIKPCIARWCGCRRRRRLGRTWLRARRKQRVAVQRERWGDEVARVFVVHTGRRGRGSERTWWRGDIPI